MTRIYQYYDDDLRDHIIIKKIYDANQKLLFKYEKIYNDKNKIQGLIKYNKHGLMEYYLRYYYNKNESIEINKYDNKKNLLSVTKIFIDKNGYPISKMNFDSNMNLLSAVKCSE